LWEIHHFSFWQTIRFIQAQDRFLDKILEHIGTAAFMELLVKLFSSEELKEGEGIIQYLLDKGLVPKLIEKLDPTLPDSVHFHSGQVLLGITSIARNFGPKNLVLEQLKSSYLTAKILEHMVKANAPNINSTLIAGLSVLLDVIQRALGFMNEGYCLSLCQGFGNCY